MTQDTPQAGADVPGAVARNVKKLRLLKGMTQADLAALVGLEQSLIARVENEKRQVSVGEAWTLAAALGVSLSELVNYPGEYYDGRFITLIRTPLREVMMRLNDVERFASEDDPAGIGVLIRRVADGVNTYLAEVPDPYETTSNEVAMNMNLSLALVALRELPGVRGALADALAAFEDARTKRQALDPLDDLGELRALGQALGSGTIHR
ncbi:hypothetical protein DEA06_06820 [Microbacterium sp. Gd 4-13]|uniref:helix-turn-helix transcriptional regulator n=1 Tax=Microbacterium sp. Gd 4-13 TaxID=2173179 RepID=UPI000D581712|nr:helix-turn-helix transcriptional regulator [Microbacterium sp. Gd 4-13]PVW05446.1 hypothetical protein DEA06_06820 [Microbacterium sp. Gd 4-13]